MKTVAKLTLGDSAKQLHFGMHLTGRFTARR